MTRPRTQRATGPPLQVSFASTGQQADQHRGHRRVEGEPAGFRTNSAQMPTKAPRLPWPGLLSEGWSRTAQLRSADQAISPARGPIWAEVRFPIRRRKCGSGAGPSQLISFGPDIVKLPIVKNQPALIRTRRNIDITVLPANLVIRIGSPRVELLRGIVIETADR